MNGFLALALLLAPCAALAAGGDAAALMSRGIELGRAAQYEEALRAFNGAAELSPKDGKVYFNRAVVRLKLKRRDAALADFKKSCSLGNAEGCKVASQLEEHEKNRYPGAKAELADAAALSEGGKYDEALAALAALAVKYPDYAQIWYLRGQIFRDGKKDAEKAIESLDRAVELNPSFADAYFLRGSMRGGLRQLGAALADMDKAVQYGPESAKFLSARGGLYLATGKTDAALADFLKAAELEPDYEPAQSGLGFAYRDKGLYAKAGPPLEKACRLKNKDACKSAEEAAQKVSKTTAAVSIPDILMEAARCEKKGRHEDALRQADRVLALNPDSYEAFMMKGHIYMSGLRDDAKAAEAFSGALDIKPDSLPARSARAFAHKNKGDYGAALADLDYAVKIDAADYKLFAQRGGVRLLMEDHGGAAEDYRRAIALYAKDAELYFGLANACKKTGDKVCASGNMDKSCDMGFKTACIYARSMKYDK
ncbi:MAG: tetratricopeptide repeat protein [Elusimicrobiales bacterium]|nr:tetratricopeptide repeat protein [Elusimicrobiales bacterium]